jgi:hypothetical protein
MHGQCIALQAVVASPSVFGHNYSAKHEKVDTREAHYWNTRILASSQQSCLVISSLIANFCPKTRTVHCLDRRFLDQVAPCMSGFPHHAFCNTGLNAPSHLQDGDGTYGIKR